MCSVTQSYLHSLQCYGLDPEAHQASLSMEFFRQPTGVGCHFLFQGIFLTQGMNLHLLHLPHYHCATWGASHLPTHLSRSWIIWSLPVSPASCHDIFLLCFSLYPSLKRPLIMTPLPRKLSPTYSSITNSYNTFLRKPNWCSNYNLLYYLLLVLHSTSYNFY